MDAAINQEGKLRNEVESKYYYYKKTFLYAIAIACIITIPFIIYEWVVTGHGIFLYYGDYNAQQICFYKHCVEMVRSGNVSWDWYTDMGSNFVGSYSYYMLGSPFFWLMCAFPSSWTPYLMGPMYIVKYIVAAMLAYCYLKRWVRHQNYAVIGALLYAFSGFQIYNTFFNQFHDSVAFFPLLLIGMEELIQNNRKGVFAIAVCINAMINYFMFAGQVAFCIIYFLFRCADRSFGITLKKFLMLAAEAVMGALMCMVIFLPAAKGVLGNSRLDRSFSTLEKVFFWIKDDALYWQRYGQIIESYFFPPDIPSRVNMFCGHKERWASISGWLPMFGMTGVFALFTGKRRNWLKALAIFLVVCSLVPGLNSIFYLGNSSYYARWMYMMVMVFVVGTIISLDDSSIRWKGALTASVGCISAIMIPLGLLWYDNPYTEDTVDYQLGRGPYTLRYWIYAAIALGSILALWWIIKHWRGTKMFSKKLLSAVTCVIIVFACIHITNGKEYSYSSDFMVNQVINGDVQLPSAEEEFYRIDFYRTSSISTIDNLNIYWNYPSIECFHTVVPSSIMDFYSLIDYSRGVGSRTNTSWYGLRGLTSTEYCFIRTTTNKRQVVSVEPGSEEEETYLDDDDWKFLETQDGMNYYVKEKFDTSTGWTYYDTQNEFDIYHNDNYITMGFWFDSFISESEFDKVGTGYQKANLLCSYLVVPDDEVEYYSQFMTQVTDTTRSRSTYSNYVKEVEKRRNETCTSFEWSSAGFTATATTEEPEIVFFSVPAEDGWTAKVNGETVEIHVVDGGMMAVEVPAGESTIEFTYRTNGLDLGFIITCIGIALYLLYMIFFKIIKKEKASYHFFKENYFEESDKNYVKATKQPVEFLQAEELPAGESPEKRNEENENGQELKQ